MYASSFTPCQERAAPTAAAEYAKDSSIRLGTTQLQHLTDAGVPPRTLIALLAEAGSIIPDENILAILMAMLSPYRNLTGTGSKSSTFPTTPLTER